MLAASHGPDILNRRMRPRSVRSGGTSTTLMRDSPFTDEDRYARAERILERWIAGEDGDQSLGLADLIARHPELEREIEELHALCSVVDQALLAGKRPIDSERASVEALIAEMAASQSDGSRYKLEEEVGRGAMGAVYRVFDTQLDRRLAMKLVLGSSEESRAGRSHRGAAKMLRRFLNEARITSQLDHPGIVPVHELGLDDEGRAYFTMKLVKGRTLADVFERHARKDPEWNHARVLSVLQRVCEAMAFAHERRVIHRDLKPANVMVGDFGEVYVMDWGLARKLDVTDERDVEHTPEDSRRPDETRTGDVVGTPAYMPPEQAEGRLDSLGPQSDVYSVGAMLYQLLAGHPPYCDPGESASAETVMERLKSEPPRALSSRDHGPPELIAITNRAMARIPARRYGDMQELARELGAFLDGRVVAAYQTGSWAEAKKWVARNKPLAVALSSAILLLIAGLSASLVFKSRAETSALLATRKANDVLSLSAIQELKELEVDADRLWPAHPENAVKYEAWLAKAKLLVEGRETDEGFGKPAHPSRADHETKLAEIRKHARRPTAEEIEEDKRQSPSFVSWKSERAHLEWMQRMLGVLSWPSEPEIESALAKEKLPVDANSLNETAWPLVDMDPTKIQYGSEVKALVLAKRAVAAAQASERGAIRDTLAWANFRTGRFDEARAEEQRALAEVETARRVEFERYLANLEAAIGEWRADGKRAARVGEAAALAERVAELQRDVDTRRTYVFDDAQDQWWHAQLSELVSDLEQFTEERSGGLFSSGASERHGWGIPKRAEFARTIRARSIDGPEARKRWDEAIDSIARSPMYAGLRLAPQMGLLPIGEDPESHLWEFAHLQTGEPAERGADGKLIAKESMGLVFVLIPERNAWVGAQSTDPSGRNFDPRTNANEFPPHAIHLSPYFISKYEMTQQQWESLTGSNPSFHGRANYAPNCNEGSRPWNGLHPVENISWIEATVRLAQLDLGLPTEDQWELACRAGTDGPFWSGDKESLAGVANVADAFAKAVNGRSSGAFESWSDGNALHAEVGSYRPNAFGLHDVHGNVWEWCSNALPPPTAGASASLRVSRGGSYYDEAWSARAAYRFITTSDFRDNRHGVRPVKAIGP
jgi:serine/threonine protein kinase/formylglycine-generating enzyme required for sulfatase activity